MDQFAVYVDDGIILVDGDFVQVNESGALTVYGPAAFGRATFSKGSWTKCVRAGADLSLLVPKKPMTDDWHVVDGSVGSEPRPCIRNKTNPKHNLWAMSYDWANEICGLLNREGV